MVTELAGKVAIVTAAAHGIGRATAVLMAERGADLALVDIDATGLKVTAERCREHGVDALELVVDQRDSAQVNAAIADTTARYGRVDVMANIVGVYPFAFVEEMSDEFWDDVIRTNLTGIFYWCRGILPVMKEQRSGSIINVTSSGTAGLSAYGASKGGVTYFTHALVAEAGPHGVRVNLVSPGPTDVREAEEEERRVADHAALGAFEERRASGAMRLSAPRECAEVIAFLASDRAQYVHGANYGVNVGGRLG